MSSWSCNYLTPVTTSFIHQRVGIILMDGLRGRKVDPKKVQWQTARHVCYHLLMVISLFFDHYQQMVANMGTKLGPFVYHVDHAAKFQK